jgi:hypothetical protein
MGELQSWSECGGEDKFILVLGIEPIDEHG